MRKYHINIMHHRICTMSPVDEEEEDTPRSAYAALKTSELDSRVCALEKEVDSMRNSLECRTLAGAACLLIWLIF